jgi:hypothetical protein
MKQLPIELFFFIVMVPLIIIAIPFLFIIELLNNFKRGILFDFS